MHSYSGNIEVTVLGKKEQEGNVLSMFPLSDTADQFQRVRQSTQSRTK